MKSSLVFFALVASFFVSSITFAQSYEIDLFRRNEADALIWQQKYQSAPSGSWEETNAKNGRDRSIQQALNAIRQQYAFYRLNYQQIESFADEMNTKYNQASSGSQIESMYRQAQDYSFNALNAELIEEIRSLNNNWRALHQFALFCDDKYQAASSGSQKEKAYANARSQAWTHFPQAVNNETYYFNDFTQHEQFADQFGLYYQQAPSGSLKESAYKNIHLSNYDQAFQKASNQLRYFSQNQLYSIQARYEQLFQQAPSGSAKENYYRKIRDLARNLIPRHP